MIKLSKNMIRTKHDKKHDKETIEEVLMLHFDRGWSYSEIAKKLGLPSRTAVAGIIYRHRRKEHASKGSPKVLEVR